MPRRYHSQTRLGIIGCGAVTETVHLPALQRAGVEVRALVDRDLERARRLAQHCRSAEVFNQVGDLTGRVDAAIVATPHSVHAQLACELLADGIHVLIEKPMAMNPHECSNIIQASAASGRVVEVGLMRRHLRANKLLVRLVRSGGLGRIMSFDLREGYQFTWPVTSASFFRRATNGGGVLVDTGAHALDLIAWLFPDALVSSYRDDSLGGAEADCSIELLTGSGTRGTVELSRTRELRNSIIVKGTAGTIELDIYGRYSHVSLQRTDRTAISWPRHLRPQSIEQLFDLQLRRWLEAIDGASIAVGPLEASKSVGLIDDCYSQRQPLELSWLPTVRTDAS